MDPHGVEKIGVTARKGCQDYNQDYNGFRSAEVPLIHDAPCPHEKWQLTKWYQNPHAELPFD